MFGTAFRDAVAAVGGDRIKPALDVAEALATAAAEGALGLPPPLPPTDDGLAFLHTSIIAATLCKAVYHCTIEDVGRVTAIPLPGAAGSPASATLLHFREAHAPPGVTGDAAAGGPQQYGLWRVAGGRGLVLAFRGTATRHDALVDAAIAPSRLGRPEGGGGGGARGGGGDGGDDDDDNDPGYATGLAAHHGFLTGARRHARDIAALIARFNGRGAAAAGPVWLAGHSLGGAYAAALALELLARRDGSAARLFGGAPGGVVTFGAPMVWVGPPTAAAAGGGDGSSSGRRRRRTPPPPSPPSRSAVRAAHARLASLEAAHLCALREAGVARPARLTWAAFVNGADLVPRALGSPLGGVAAALGSAVPVLAPARAAAARYRPFGSYLLIVAGSVRVAGASPVVGGGVGTAASADAVATHLHAGRAWSAAAAGAAAVKAESAHDLAAYRSGLEAYAGVLAGRRAGGAGQRSTTTTATTTRRRRGRGMEGDDPLSAACDLATDLGRALGDASSAAAARLREAAAHTARSTWRAAAAAAVVAVSARLGGGAAVGEPALSGVGAGASAASPADPPPPRRRRLLGRKGGVV